MSTKKSLIDYPWGGAPSYRLVLQLPNSDNYHSLKHITSVWCRVHSLKAPILIHYQTGQVTLYLYSDREQAQQCQRFIIAWAAKAQVTLDVRACMSVGR